MSDGQSSAQPQASAASEAPAADQSAVIESTDAGNEEVTAEEVEALAADSSEESSEGQEAKDSATKAEKEIAKASEKEVEAAKQSLKRKYKLKVDGEELDAELTDEEVARELQLAKKARKEIQSASEIKKEAALLLELLKTDPKRVLSDPSIGMDVVKFAQDILSQEIEEQKKDPAVREKEKLERELEEMRKQMKEEKEAREKEEYDRMVKQAEADLEEKVQEALDTSGLPKSPYILKKMADVMVSALSVHGKEISPKQAMNIVKKEMMKDIKELFDASPDDVLEELIGNNNIKRISKTRLAKVKKSVPTADSIKPVAEKQVEEKAPDKISIKDWLRS